MPDDPGADGAELHRPAQAFDRLRQVVLQSGDLGEQDLHLVPAGPLVLRLDQQGLGLRQRLDLLRRQGRGPFRFPLAPFQAGPHPHDRDGGLCKAGLGRCCPP
jgi:hypothetical protein